MTDLQTGRMQETGQVQLCLKRPGHADGNVTMAFPDKAQRQYMIELLAGCGYEIGKDPTAPSASDTILVLCPVGPAERKGACTSMSAPGCGDCDLDVLTPRERQVLDLVTAGDTSKQIAAKLSISVRTVENHRLQIMRKLNASGLAHLVRITLDRAPA